MNENCNCWIELSRYVKDHYKDKVLLSLCPTLTCVHRVQQDILSYPH